MVYKWYILPIGGLYATYHLLGEPETTIECLISWGKRGLDLVAGLDLFFYASWSFLLLAVMAVPWSKIPWVQGKNFMGFCHTISWQQIGGLWLIWLVVSNIFYFHPYLGKISNLTSIFFKGVETTN